jgi:serine acetyltransferase
MTLRRLLISDYVRLYDGRGETPGRLRSQAPSRFLTNPSLHAVALMRTALAGSEATAAASRRILEAKHGIEIGEGSSIGPGLVLPHPFGIRIAPGTVIGADAMIYHNVTVGSPGEPPPRIGDGAILHMDATVAGGAVIGDGAVLGAGSLAEGEIAPGEVVKLRR